METQEKEKPRILLTLPHTVAQRPRLRMLSARRFNKLIELINRYGEESRKCAKVRAYYGACILLGAVLEGMLLAMCDMFPDEAQSWFCALPPQQRPKAAIAKWDFSTLAKAARAIGWLPGRRTGRAPRQIGDLVEFLRELRNMIHPGKHLRDYPNVRIGRLHLRDAEAVFDAAHGWLYSRVTGDLNQTFQKSLRRKRER